MPIIYVHGGVSGTGRSVPQLGYATTPRGPAALDLVEAAVQLLEDDPALNAGRGAVLNRAGRLELDAGIAEGSSGRAGGIANVTVRHPISLARKVMEETPHVLVTGDGARALGRDMEQVGDPMPEQRLRWERARAEGELDRLRFGAPEHVDTVGAVALDDRGGLAAGSSTGGVFGKLPGRVGDAPVFGAGFYASGHAAVVGTGLGELFLRTLAASAVGHRIEGGATPQAACEEVIAMLGERDERAAAGLLALDVRGRVGACYRGASWSVAGPDGPVHATRIAAAP